MNNKIRRLKIFMLFCVLAISANAQFQYRFYPLQIKQGLSSNRTNAIFRDSQGYVWITTENGLNRYDGHRFRHYSTSYDKQNFYSNYTWGVSEDGNGVLWVGMRDSYNTLYYPKEDRFDWDTGTYLKKLGFKGDFMQSAVDIDDQKNIWLYSEKAVDHYNFKLKRWRHYNIPGVQGLYIASNSAYLIQKDLSISIIPFNGQKVRTDTSLKSEASNFVHDYPFIFVDSRGGIWVYGFRHDKLYYKEPGATIWHKFISNVDCPMMDIYDIDEDPYGTVLLAMGRSSLCYYDRASKTIRQYDSDYSRLMKGVINDVEVLDNTIWVCYDKQGLGVAFAPLKGMEMSLLNNASFDNLRYSDCTAIGFDKNRISWYGTNGGGVTALDPTLKLIQHYDFESPLNDALSIFCDTKNRTWVSSCRDGIYMFETPSSAPLHIKSGTNGLEDDDIMCFGTDTKGNIWAAIDNGGLQKWNENTKTFSAKILNDLDVNEIKLLPTNKMILATAEGHYEFNPSTGKAEKCKNEEAAFNKFGIVDQTDNCICYDYRHWMWEGGNSGIIITNGNNESVHIGKEDGLCNEVIQGIVEDMQHNIWVSTENGVCRIIVPKGTPKLEAKNLKIQNFSIYDGLKSNFCNPNALATALDYVIVGSPDGISVIKTDDVPEIRKRSRVYITELCIGNDSVCANVDTTKTYYIPSDETMFKIRFSILNDDEAKEFLYAYRLEDGDKWEYTTDTELTFSHLAPGHYTIELCMFAESEEDTGLITHLNVYIRYPWYRTWWAYILYLLVAIGIGFGVYRLRKQFKSMRDSVSEMQRGFMLAMEKRENERLRSEIAAADIEVTNADEELKMRTIEIIEKNIDNSDFTVELLSKELGMSRANLHRKLVGIVGQGPLGFIRTVRLQHAKQLLIKSQMTVAEIAYAVGFNNPKNFSRYFKEEYGDTPSQYREKVNATLNES